MAVELCFRLIKEKFDLPKLKPIVFQRLNKKKVLKTVLYFGLFSTIIIGLRKNTMFGQRKMDGI